MIDWATGLIAAGGPSGVFLLMVLENLFPPIPSEVVMPLAGFAAARGHMSLPMVLLAGIAGSLCGNAVWFELARAYGAARMRRLVERFGRYVGLGPAVLERAESALRRNGPVAVCLSRMMPGLRTAISVPAGLVELPRRVFYVWTLIGTSVWTGGLALAGFALEDRFHLVERWAGPIGMAMMLAVFGILTWRVVLARRRAKQAEG